MSKITNVGLTPSGTGFIIAVQQWANLRSNHNSIDPLTSHWETVFNNARDIDIGEYRQTGTSLIPRYGTVYGDTYVDWWYGGRWALSVNVTQLRSLTARLLWTSCHWCLYTTLQHPADQRELREDILAALVQHTHWTASTGCHRTFPSALTYVYVYDSVQ